MMACKEQIQQDITETLQSTELYPKILKYIELFSDHVDSSSLSDLYNVIKSGNKPSKHLLSTIVREAETNDKLLKWIEVLLRQF
jgi:hypothetical protein